MKAWRRRPKVRSNGEVEGPDDHARQAPRAHTVPRRPRRQAAYASRPPPKSAADLRSQPIRNLGVPGNCFNVTGLGIAPKRVRAPLALQIAAVMTQMPQQRTAFHSTVTVSRVTPFGRPRSASARRSRRIRAIAAARLFRAAAFVRPCPFAPGTSAQYATNHLPSRSIIAVNSFRMAPLYRARALAPWPSNGEAEGPGTGA